ncbi:MAG: DUF134 domain-containing protein [Bacteroidales bacterium]|jgi:predicted DNA-binding protein (UPF0251 family)
MARPKKLRKLINPPSVKGFTPIGNTTVKGQHPILIDYDEYEALRLADYSMSNHLQAAETMHVSRATFTRIYAHARRKIATALVEGRPLIFQGGPVYFDSQWYYCKQCPCYFNHLDKDNPIVKCPLCLSANTTPCTEKTF